MEKPMNETLDRLEKIKKKLDNYHGLEDIYADCHFLLHVIAKTKEEPWLGNATTEQLLDELRARCEINGTLHYRPVDIDE